jgi:branched-chain amino acid transport system ATP-binding protein
MSAAPGAAPPALAVAGLARAFGGLRAVDGVDFEVARGEMVALIGPNGAGKSTCFNLIDGQLRADAGHVRVAGRAIGGLAPDAIARQGVGRTFQVAAIFASMSVRENVEVARHALGQAADANAADALLDAVGAGGLADRHAAVLAYGDAKRVELALALAGAPQLLLLDEPTAGLAPADRGALMRVVRTRVDADAVAVLFTEHDMDVVFAFADRVIVLDRGRVIAQGTPAEVRASPDVRRAYLGSG